MLGWVVSLLIIALVGGGFALGALAGGAVKIAKVLLAVGLLAFLLLASRRRPPAA